MYNADPEKKDDVDKIIDSLDLDSSSLPQEYASFILSNGNAKEDKEQDKEKTGDEVRKNLAKIILAANAKKQSEGVSDGSKITLADIFPNADIKIGSVNSLETVRNAETTTTEQQTTEQLTTTTEQPTTTQEATTEDPTNFPKSGNIELLVPDITYAGHMIHWSIEQQYLAVSDIWGQKYLRFNEIIEEETTTARAVTTTTEAVTTTVAQAEEVVTTTQSAEGRTVGQTETTTTEAETTTETTEIPTTTAEPLPYEIKVIQVPTDVVYLIRPQGKTEGSYPAIIPVHDDYNFTDQTDEIIIAYNDKFHLAFWDAESDAT